MVTSLIPIVSRVLYHQWFEAEARIGWVPHRGGDIGQGKSRQDPLDEAHKRRSPASLGGRCPHTPRQQNDQLARHVGRALREYIPGSAVRDGGPTMHRIRLITLSVAAAAALIAWSAGAASADPTNAKNAFPIQVACDNGHTYNAVANGSGHFTPAHDLDSNAVVVPVAFGETTFTVTDPDGNVVDSETDPPASKGS